MSSFAVIFDMDGVIVDSEPVYNSWNQQMFDQLGAFVPREIRLQLIGIGTKNKWQLIKEYCSLPQTIEELVQYQKDFHKTKEIFFGDLLFRGVKTLLDSLKKQEISIALASSSNRDRINQVIKDCKLNGYFEVVVSGAEFKETKPNPEIFLHTAQQLGKQPRDCIVIEDSYNGLLAAERAGMRKIGIKHAHTPMDLSLANHTVTSMNQINVNLIEYVHHETNLVSSH